MYFLTFLLRLCAFYYDLCADFSDSASDVPDIVSNEERNFLDQALGYTYAEAIQILKAKQQVLPKVH